MASKSKRPTYIKAGSQNHQILEHLKKHKHITPLEAIGVYRCFRLASRIDELRGLGYQISTQKVRDATGKQYARYSLLSHEPTIDTRNLPSKQVAA
jgi:hypothetical protein